MTPNYPRLDFVKLTEWLAAEFKLVPGFESAFEQALHAAPQEDREAVLKTALDQKGSPRRWPPKIRELLVRMAALEGLRRWTEKYVNSGSPRAPDSQETIRAGLEDWLDSLKDGERAALIEAAVRFLAGQADAESLDRLAAMWKNFQDLQTKGGEIPMADFIIDQRGLPESFSPATQAAFVVAVTEQLKRFELTGAAPSGANRIAVIIGALLNKGYFSTEGPDFQAALRTAWEAGLADVPREREPNPSAPFANTIPAREVYDLIVAAIPQFPGRGGSPPSSPRIFYQEIAFVADYVIANAKSVPVGHPNFGTQIRLGLDKYVTGLPPTDSLSISLSLGDEGQDLNIEPENIRAVGTVAFVYHCEKMRLFHVTDRITQLHMNGLLPTGFDAGGKLLDSYYWDSEDRLNEAARNMVYSRCLGVTGGDVSKDVQPNKEFDSRLMRFVASLAEYDRQQRVTDLFESARGATLRLTAEQVRKTGRDLAANASLYGWGGTQFAARRLKDHVLKSFEILRNTQIQRIYGVTNPYQMIERVSINDFGASPNIVKHKTMADASIAILEVVAKRSNAWSTSSVRPLFPERGVAGEVDIPAADMEILMLQAQNILSMLGIPTEQVGRLSQPSDTVFAPSMPAFGAVNPQGGGSPSGDAMDKLKQMITAGTTPTLEQLQQMVMAGH